MKEAHPRSLSGGFVHGTQLRAFRCTAKLEGCPSGDEKPTVLLQFGLVWRTESEEKKSPVGQCPPFVSI